MRCVSNCKRLLAERLSGGNLQLAAQQGCRELRPVERHACASSLFGMFHALWLQLIQPTESKVVAVCWAHSSPAVFRAWLLPLVIHAELWGMQQSWLSQPLLHGRQCIPFLGSDTYMTATLEHQYMGVLFVFGRRGQGIFLIFFPRSLAVVVKVELNVCRLQVSHFKPCCVPEPSGLAGACLGNLFPDNIARLLVVPLAASTSSSWCAGTWSMHTGVAACVCVAVNVGVVSGQRRMRQHCDRPNLWGTRGGKGVHLHRLAPGDALGYTDMCSKTCCIASCTTCADCTVNVDRSACMAVLPVNTRRNVRRCSQGAALTHALWLCCFQCMDPCMLLAKHGILLLVAVAFLMHS